MAPQRFTTVPITLKDGTLIPAGAKVGFPSYHHMNDPETTPNPETFDPLRSYRKRHASPDQMTKHIAGQTSMTNLAFGYGNQACPGRYLAVGEAKMILARLLSDFDFKFKEGQTRPQSIGADENMMPDPSVKVLMRRRRRE